MDVNTIFDPSVLMVESIQDAHAKGLRLNLGISLTEIKEATLKNR